MFIQGLVNVICGTSRKYLSKKEVANYIEDGFFMFLFNLCFYEILLFYSFSTFVYLIFYFYFYLTKSIEDTYVFSLIFFFILLVTFFFYM